MHRCMAPERIGGGYAMSYMDEYRFWLEDDYFDQDTKKELEAIGGN